VSREKYIFDRKKISILKSHRDHKLTNLKLNENINVFLKKEHLIVEAPSNKSLKFLEMHKKGCKFICMTGLDNEINQSMTNDDRKSNISRISQNNRPIYKKSRNLMGKITSSESTNHYKNIKDRSFLPKIKSGLLSEDSSEKFVNY
jgi:hypothetical protein